MAILAFDTSFNACSVAVWPAAPVARACARLEPMATGHAERLIPMIGDVLCEAGLGYGDVSSIAVTTGPGTFTGTRIGVAAARALSLALGVPIRPASSLSVIAWTAADQIGDVGTVTLCVALDARREEIYWQRHDGATGVALGPPCLSTPAAAAAEIADRPAIIVGSAGALVAAEARAGTTASAVRALMPDIAPDALSLARRACGLATVQHPEPLYLRAPDAKPPSGPAIERVSS
ncbi:MAG: tRNA (adenosine(37)-N6)-threonylcarbamoyltransferase complex dimerization subunit type 1 TsaB [Hyphomicrobiaceae bacterium]|nr:tRNA (adenosine(37)-N6)-threonylcarbamoyltransferase complex dimerization subunit type 1 TsaB [Hyphomicrobiaceae bacterium]